MANLYLAPSSPYRTSENEGLTAHDHDAGTDLRVDRILTPTGETGPAFYSLRPGEVVTVATGVYLSLEHNEAGLVLSRSGLARDGLVVANSPGLVDPGYTGEVLVVLRNVTRNACLPVVAGHRVAQLLVVPFVLPRVEVVGNPADEALKASTVALGYTDRLGEGFGSTGVQ
jgi:dUTP pyrophosphatase